MAALPNQIDPFIHDVSGRLIVSRCAQCGLVVAASPLESVLLFAERLHVCPVYLNYNEAQLGRPTPKATR